jgi:hypothetical protein
MPRTFGLALVTAPSQLRKYLTRTWPSFCLAARQVDDALTASLVMVPFVGQPKSRDDSDGYGRLPLDGIELCTLNLW